MRFLRRRPVPPAVKAVTLPPGERRLAWALSTAGGPVLATDAARGLVDGPRLPWPGVERASWQRPRLTGLEVETVEGTGARHVLELEDDGDLPEVVRTRVTASVAWSSHARLTPHGGVRIVGRRRPGIEVLDWQLVYDPGTDLTDPLVRAQAEELLEGARRTIG